MINNLILRNILVCTNINNITIASNDLNNEEKRILIDKLINNMRVVCFNLLKKTFYTKLNIDNTFPREMIYKILTCIISYDTLSEYFAITKQSECLIYSYVVLICNAFFNTYGRMIYTAESFDTLSENDYKELKIKNIFAENGDMRNTSILENIKLSCIIKYEDFILLSKNDISTNVTLFSMFMSQKDNNISICDALYAIKFSEIENTFNISDDTTWQSYAVDENTESNESKWKQSIIDLLNQIK